MRVTYSALVVNVNSGKRDLEVSRNIDIEDVNDLPAVFTMISKEIAQELVYVVEAVKRNVWEGKQVEYAIIIKGEPNNVEEVKA